MFLFSILIGIVLGFIFRGNLKNLGNVRFNDLYLIAFGYGIEVILKVFINFGFLNIGISTFIIDIIMYTILFLFIYLNRKDVFIIIIGIGFLLNAVAIFSNGGAMPVSQSAMDSIASNVDPSIYGLYESMGEGVRAWYLCDLIYIKSIGPYVFSIGDIISGIGMIVIIINGMKGKYNTIEISHSKGRSSRKNRRIRRNKNNNVIQFIKNEIIEIKGIL